MIINSAKVKVTPSFLIANCIKKRRDRPQSRKYLPDEIWLEIFSILPLKSLSICRCVCKLWRDLFFTLENMINSDPLYVPLCGLLLISFGTKNDNFTMSYLCLRTKKSFSILNPSIENNSIYSSGFERGLLSNLSFDFTTIRNHDASKGGFLSFALNGGLLIANFDDGTSEVHNPTTKKNYFVPKSRIVAKYGFGDHTGWEKHGLVIQFPPSLSGQQRCRFIVIRIAICMRFIEVYYSETRKWRKYRLKLEDELLSLVCWRLYNYVGMFESGFLSLYVLTNRDRGVAIKFKDSMNSEMMQYSFPLPEVVRGGFSNARIWECERNLFLSYYNHNSLWIWKASSTLADSWAWILMLEISPGRQSCKPAANEHLSKVVLNAIDRVMPLACHPDMAVMYLLINSSFFAYYLNTDSLERIADNHLKEEEDAYLYIAHTFKPCLSFKEASEVG